MDGYPQNICVSCYNQLETAFNFVQTAVESDRKTSQFSPVPNGVLIKKSSKLPQITAKQCVQSSVKSPRKCFRHKMYMAKDLVTGTINYSAKAKRNWVNHGLRQKIVYAAKDLPQKNTNTNLTLKSRRWFHDSHMCRLLPLSAKHEEESASPSGEKIAQSDLKLHTNNVLYCLKCKTQASSGVCATCGSFLLNPVVKLHLNNVLYCLKCKIQVESGICPTCGPIRVKLMPCKVCKKDFRCHIAQDQPAFICVQCQKQWRTKNENLLWSRSST